MFLFFLCGSICFCAVSQGFFVDDFLGFSNFTSGPQRSRGPRYRAVSHRSQDQSTEDDEEIENFKLPEECGLEVVV